MADSEQMMFMLGQIKGQLDGINQRLNKLDSVESRLRKVEVKSAVHGAIGGSVAGVGVSMIVAGIREAIRTHGA